ncbi:GNAT family protein [Paenibacillus sediminis]|uniref:RimJ/RimL family protein N-acetyltransferase n=1 Tax=Paenibacillus sediminis TaxID=664909 RepID=A0ABS4H319_9BACL|nr:GNAT family protein [Paenibacillus sediminis]MBP1936920.1 RimJ/RimL family protein N-acetyltransferase [Paenibacillus sediminis]
MNVRPVELVGARAKLVPMELKHAQGLFEAGNYPEIWEFTQGNIQTYDDAVLYIEKALNSEVTLPFVIIDQDSNRVVGSTRFYEISDQNRSLEIGSTWLTPNVWRTRINTECKYLLLEHCFETLGTIRVQIKTDLRNMRSQRAIERLGAVKEGVLRNHMILPDGYVRDSVFYSILDKEWAGVKERLKGFLSN